MTNEIDELGFLNINNKTYLGQKKTIGKANPDLEIQARIK